MLNEEFKRMQKLAGILKEARFTNPDKEPDIEILRDIYYYEDFGKMASGYLSGPREKVW